MCVYTYRERDVCTRATARPSSRWPRSAWRSPTPSIIAYCSISGSIISMSSSSSSSSSSSTYCYTVVSL